MMIRVIYSKSILCFLLRMLDVMDCFFYKVVKRFSFFDKAGKQLGSALIKLSAAKLLYPACLRSRFKIELAVCSIRHRPMLSLSLGRQKKSTFRDDNLMRADPNP